MRSFAFSFKKVEDFVIRFSFFKIFIAALCLLCVMDSRVSAAVEVKKVGDGLLSVVAHRESLVRVLQKVGEVANVKIYLSDDLLEADEIVECDIQSSKVEEVFKRLVKGANISLIFYEKENKMYLDAIKIFPKGKYSAPRLIPLGKNASLRDNYNGEFGEREHVVWLDQDFKGEAKLGGAENCRLLPSVSTQALGTEGKGLSVLKAQLNRMELKKYKELMFKRKRVDEEKDPIKKYQLSLAYLGDVEEYLRLKKANKSKLESLFRIQESNKLLRRR